MNTLNQWVKKNGYAITGTVHDDVPELRSYHPRGGGAGFTCETKMAKDANGKDVIKMYLTSPQWGILRPIVKELDFNLHSVMRSGSKVYCLIAEPKPSDPRFEVGTTGYRIQKWKINAHVYRGYLIFTDYIFWSRSNGVKQETGSPTHGGPELFTSRWRWRN